KNTVCLIRRDEAFISQHVGDLENLETLHSFEHAIRHLERILEVKPECVAHDLHPDYLNTQWALARNDLPRVAVQHHHAHIASVVAERRISGPVLGLALDGTGYGTDGTIWGGEILRVEEDRFERLGHFRQVPLPGGNRAIREPWRVALSYLWCMDPANAAGTFADVVERWPADKAKIVLQMLEKRINAPLTSSCGRLFDAVSALAGLRHSVNYEGQAAIEFEQVLEPSEESYSGILAKSGGMWVLDPFPMVGEAVRDVRGGASAGYVSARFHNGLVSLLVDAVLKVRAETGLDRVALSGGVFQNAYLTGRLEKMLGREGFNVYSHMEVPPNDACISLGQAAVGAWRLARGA
ncbi:MAG: carbamoyltransferase HypF, partial [Desulfobacteraceae bacterium]|nr:carbamoyltransferase HypF [Desulfobacteraceae bacterium]